jgi:hypothetical protein
MPLTKKRQDDRAGHGRILRPQQGQAGLLRFHERLQSVRRRSEKASVVSSVQKSKDSIISERTKVIIMAKRKGGKRFKRAPLPILENAAYKLTKLVEKRGGEVQPHSHQEMSKAAKAEYRKG